MTSLTVNGSAAAATTLAAAGKMFSATGGTSGNTSTKVGSSTQFKQIFAKGTSTNQSGVGSIPAPTDSNFNGWMWDVTTLEGQRLAAGTWTPTVHLLASTGTTVTPTVAWFKRSSGGVYTSIGSVDGSSLALTTSAQALTFTPPSLALMDFATGDKLVMWLWVNQTAGGATNSTISVVEATSGSTAGVASEAQVVTPGYGPTPVALAVTMAGGGSVTWSAYAAAILADSPIRYYRLGESAGTVALDLGSQARNGTISGGVTLGQVGLLTWDSDTAMLFNGTSGTISLPTSGLPTGAAAWSIEARVKTPASMSSTHIILNFGTNASNECAELYINAGKFVLDLDGAANVMSATLSASTVYHVVGTYDGTQARLYLDGILVAGPVTITANIVASFASIGSQLGGQFWDNLLDEISINSAALTAAQVATHYQAGLASLLLTALSGTMAGTGTLSGTLGAASGGVSLTAESDGGGTVAGTLSLTTALSTTLAGVGTLTGTTQLTTALSATFAGVGTLSETFSLATTLSTTFAGVGALNETLTAETRLTTSLVGVGTLTGTLSLATALSNSLVGIGTLTGTLSTSANAALSATLAGVGQLSGTPDLRTSLTTSMIGGSTLAETLSLATSLSTTLVGSGTLDATIREQTALSTNFAGTGSAAFMLFLGTPLSLTCPGAGSVSCTVSMFVSLISSMAATALLTGTLIIEFGEGSHIRVVAPRGLLATKAARGTMSSQGARGTISEEGARGTMTEVGSRGTITIEEE